MPFDKNKFYTLEDIELLCKNLDRAKEIYNIIQSSHRLERKSNLRNKRVRKLLYEIKNH